MVLALAQEGLQENYLLGGFDLLILVPYFSILVLLALYGLHRTRLVYLYHRFRHNAPAEPPPPLEWPKVTIQLPLYNEKYVVERLLDAVAQVDYAHDRLEIQVLDDSTDDTTEAARVAIAKLANEGVPIPLLHRERRTGYKAGALAAGLEQATGEFLAVFDADFLPPRDFLRRTIPHFVDEGVGMVQARWTFLNRNYSLLTRVQAILLDAHFVLEHGARSRAGLFFNFNGTAGIWRRRAIEEAGGWEHDTLTEDTDLSYRAQLRGWRFVYRPDVECPSELPVDINAFKAQQARWTKGLLQTARKMLPRIVRAPLPLRVKAEAFFHLTATISYPLMVVLSALLLPAMIVRFHQGWNQVLWLDLPLFLGATVSVASYFLYAQRELSPRGWWRQVFLLPVLMAVGIGLALRNTRAALEALAGEESPFVRTPKYRIETARRAWYRLGYRAPEGAGLAWLELGLGVYFLWATAFALSRENYYTVPFLTLFLWGYTYTGLLSLAQPYLEQFSFAGLTLRLRQWAQTL
jgi:cellulose synthase/poly-beta-1,6-N-acetylglucosamine synthase-like glycosyltransferase